MNSRIRTSSLFLLAAVLVCGGCSNAGGSSAGGAAQTIPQQQQALRAELQPKLVKGNTPVQHIIVMIQENRTFDDFFATFPGVDGATTGKDSNGKTIPLKEAHLAARDMNHMRAQYKIDCDLKGSVCQMDGFNHTYENQFPVMPATYPYQYANPSEIAPYWFIAQNYAIGDHMFQTQGSGSFTAHQDLIAGWTKIDNTDSIVDVPSDNSHWGCDSKKGTTTDLLTTKLVEQYGAGPFPCLTYPTGTLRDLLDAKAVSWRYYSPPHKGGGGGNIWNAFDAIDAVRNGPEWQTNISVPETNIFNDLSNGTLAQMNWIVPSTVDSDHPEGNGAQYHGPEWIASVVNAVGQSQYWNNTTIVILWDDWGGFYDHVPPAFMDKYGGLGFRVPFLIISPYVAKGQVVSTQFEFASVVKYVEETFKLGSLHSNDERAHSLTTMFHFNNKPRAFVAVPSSLDKNYFLRQPPDYDPVDTQ